MTTRPRQKTLRVALLLLCVATITLLVAAPGGARHGTPGAHGSLNSAWAKANYSAYRYGWGVFLSLALADTKRDHDAVYLEAEIDVASWPNGYRTVLWNRAGPGTTKEKKFVMRAAEAGTAIRAVRFRMCRNETGFDSCKETSWRPLPQQVTHTVSGYPAARSTAEALMAGPMAGFLREKAKALAPYVWSDDGCSGPLKKGLSDSPLFVSIAFASIFTTLTGLPPPTGSPSPSLVASFGTACARHDFGYRNFGYSERGLQLDPTDARREWIDNIFLADMKAACRRVAEVTLDCSRWALRYWGVVRLLGGRAFFDAPPGEPIP